ncbi:MAG: response regulator [Gaiellaceae bacterium]
MEIPVELPMARTVGAFFRAVNDELVRLDSFAARGVRLILCECSRAGCSETLELTLAEYEAVRAHATRFLVAPGHELADVQRVLTQTERVAVIQESQECVRSQTVGANGQGATNGKRPRVLIVDDDPAIRLLCSANLETEGIVVLEAADGRRGLERARSEQPQLVLTDVMMPGLDGFQLAEALRRDRRTRRTPLIFLSGQREAAATARAYALGALAYLTKPFDPASLASLVTGVLTRFQQHTPA